MCTMPVFGPAPCQCFSPGGIHTVSPALISWIGPPFACTRPTPEMTCSVCPSGCVCHAVRAPGSKLTRPGRMRAGAGASMIGSCHTTPVNDSFGCRRVGTDPLGRISILSSALLLGGCIAAAYRPRKRVSPLLERPKKPLGLSGTAQIGGIVTAVTSRARAPRYHPCSLRDEPHAKAARPIREGRGPRAARPNPFLEPRPAPAGKGDDHAPSRPGRNFRSRSRRHLANRDASGSQSVRHALLCAVSRRLGKLRFLFVQPVPRGHQRRRRHVRRRADPERSAGLSDSPRRLRARHPRRGRLTLHSTKQRSPASLPGFFAFTCFAALYACWIAESSQLPPCARVKVHTSVASCGALLPSAAFPVARSM